MRLSYKSNQNLHNQETCVRNWNVQVLPVIYTNGLVMIPRTSTRTIP